ncbi:protocadherin alpha-11-like [Rhinolophus sinicus]|uniref:protocadherin alpha-11-like n=1 Tax=Rhinolophus sinicus TaxID=89399 RepID=UPI003D7B0E62
MTYAMFRSLKRGLSTKRLLLSLLLLAFWEAGSGQVHYSVPEEVKHGTFVGRIAQDLGLELAELVPRLFRVSSKGHGDLLEVNLQNGILFVNSRIDREELCGRSAECSIHLEVIVERPLQVFHVEVEIKDINDNPPVFSLREQKLLISESKQPDSHFPLEGASDADIGENALLTYRLSKNEYFSLELPANSKPTNRLSLALKKPLDREKTPEVSLLLTAVDRGKPELTGTVQLFIRVLDINDNDPEFEQSEYKVRLMENAAKETFVIKLNATDRDEGVNGEVTYSLMSIKPNGKSLFTIDENNGEVRVNGILDYEENKFYEIEVRATDKGNPLMAGHCTVWVEILDANDNAPEITVTSLSLTVREDTQTSTVIALISVSDRDSGANGQVTCSLTPSVPFKITSTFKNYYSLVLDSALDRESVSVYELVVTARDGGSPSLSATASVSVEVADKICALKFHPFLKHRKPRREVQETGRAGQCSCTCPLGSLSTFRLIAGRRGAALPPSPPLPPPPPTFPPPTAPCDAASLPGAQPPNIIGIFSTSGGPPQLMSDSRGKPQWTLIGWRRHRRAAPAVDISIGWRRQRREAPVG